MTELYNGEKNTMKFSLFLLCIREREYSFATARKFFFSEMVQLELFHSSDRLQSLASSGANSATKLAKGTITNHSSQVLPL